MEIFCCCIFSNSFRRPYNHVIFLNKIIMSVLSCLYIVFSLFGCRIFFVEGEGTRPTLLGVKSMHSPV